MKNAWRKLLVAGFIGSLTVAAGCVVGSSDDNTGGSGGSSGSGGSTGGASGSGGATGGASGSGATGGMAGAAGSGAAAAYTCDNDKAGATGTPAATCDDLSDTDVCQACVKASCCEEWKTCLSENPNDACAYGGPKDATSGEYPGEIICFQGCVKDAGIADATTIATCAGNCTSDGCGTISDATNGMVTCMQDKCFTECLQP